MSPWLSTAFLHGALLCAFMTVVIGATLAHDPRIWTNSLPPDARELAGPAPARSVARRRWWSAVMLVGLVALFGHLAREIRGAGGGALEVGLAAFVAFELFNLFDALVIDLGLVLVRPRWAVIPGTEQAAGFRDPRWHLRAFLVGAAGGVPFALLVAALDGLVRLLGG